MRPDTIRHATALAAFTFTALACCGPHTNPDATITRVRGGQCELVVVEEGEALQVGYRDRTLHAFEGVVQDGAGLVRDGAHVDWNPDGVGGWGEQGCIAVEREAVLHDCIEERRCQGDDGRGT